jgi:hypothetical protein
VQSFEKYRKGIPEKAIRHGFRISCDDDIWIGSQEVSESRRPPIIIYFEAQILEFFGRRTAILVAVKDDPDSGFRQRPELVIYVNHTAVIGRMGDVKRYYMQVLRGHKGIAD